MNLNTLALASRGCVQFLVPFFQIRWGSKRLRWNVNSVLMIIIMYSVFRAEQIFVNYSGIILGHNVEKKVGWRKLIMKLTLSNEFIP